MLVHRGTPICYSFAKSEKKNLLGKRNLKTYNELLFVKTKLLATFRRKINGNELDNR